MKSTARGDLGGKYLTLVISKAWSVKMGYQKTFYDFDEI